jgi:hypothetical protein
MSNEKLTKEERVKLIKWGCKYTKSFFLLKGPGDFTTFRCVLYAHAHEIEWWLKDGLFYDFGWPLFLQQVIEGINRLESGKVDITQFSNAVTVDYDSKGMRIKTFFYSQFGSINQAKEVALKYIMDQEEEE